MRALTLAALFSVLPVAASAQVLPFVAPLLPDSVFALRNRANSLERFLGEDGVSRPENRVKVDSIRTWRKRAQDEVDRVYGDPALSLIGSGGLKGFTPYDSTQKVATGSLGLRLVTSSAQYTALINVVAEDPVVRSGFAAAMLASGSGARGVVLDYQQARKATTFVGGNMPPRRWGLQAQAALSSTTWSYRDSSRNVLVFAGSAKATKDLFYAADTSKDHSDLRYGLRFDAGPAIRFLDVEGAAASEFRNQVLGNRSSVYVGGEAGVTLLIGYFVATARLNWFPDFGVGPVNGLTGLHFSTGIALQAPLASLPVRFR